MIDRPGDSVSGWDMPTDIRKEREMMRKSIGIAWVCMLALIVFPSMASAADQGIVFIDLDRTFSDFYKTKLADAQLKEQADEFNDERTQLVDDYDNLQKEFNDLREKAQNTALSEDARSESRDLAEDKLIEIRDFESRIQRFDQSRKKQLDDQSRRMRKRIVGEIRKAIQNHARMEGYQAVLDSSAQSLNGVETVLFVDPKVDITDDVLDILNKGSEDEEE